QLISANFASTNPSIANQSIQIIYDADGNREFMTINGNLIDYGTNELNQYTSVDGVAYAYDADGNLTFDGSRQYSFDQFNRLSTIDDGTNIESFGYNMLEKLSGSSFNLTDTFYLAAPDLEGVPFAEYNGSGALLAHNVIGAGL